MRQVKFRGKRTDNGEWVYGDLLRVGGGCLIYFGSKTETATPSIPKDSNVAVELFNDEVAVVVSDTIGQFTGLTDCNGKEIYEGDILRYCDKNGKVYNREVIFHHGCFKLRNLDVRLPDTPICHHVVDEKLNWEVWGNIHSNPELLKSE